MPQSELRLGRYTFIEIVRFSPAFEVTVTTIVYLYEPKRYCVNLVIQGLNFYSFTHEMWKQLDVAVESTKIQARKFIADNHLQGGGYFG